MEYTRKLFMLPMPEKIFTSDGKGHASWTTEISTRHIKTVDMFEAEEVGLGYYVDPANADGTRKDSHEIVGGRDWYVTCHLESGNVVHLLFFYSEEHVKTYIEQIATLVDWRKPIPDLQKVPGWMDTQVTIRRIAQSITSDFLEIISSCEE